MKTIAFSRNSIETISGGGDSVGGCRWGDWNHREALTDSDWPVATIHLGFISLPSIPPIHPVGYQSVFFLSKNLIPSFRRGIQEDFVLNFATNSRGLLLEIYIRSTEEEQKHLSNVPEFNSNFTTIRQPPTRPQSRPMEDVYARTWLPVINVYSTQLTCLVFFSVVL